ncbi:hypothetical protein BS78_03G018600 [Paspalum vaginatum]|nr:hypothetical protein BS78_03G018600 [Paspalum vaginatum]
MQGGRSASAVEAAKEAAANVGASAWSGKEKAKAVVQEKAAKARAHDPAEKAAADARMQERVREVEAAKQDAKRGRQGACHRGRAPPDAARGAGGCYGGGPSSSEARARRRRPTSSRWVRRKRRRCPSSTGERHGRWPLHLMKQTESAPVRLCACELWLWRLSRKFYLHMLDVVGAGSVFRKAIAQTENIGLNAMYYTLAIGPPLATGQHYMNDKIIIL